MESWTLLTEFMNLYFVNLLCGLRPLSKVEYWREREREREREGERERKKDMDRYIERVKDGET